MTGARKPDLPGTYFLEFNCERLCQVEFDLAEVHIRFTHGQMLEHAKAAHSAAHGAAEKVFNFHDRALVKAQIKEAAS